MKLFKLHRSPNGRQAAAVVITVIFVLLLSIFYLRESAESRAKASGTGREGINPPHAASAITLEPRVVAPAHSAG